MFWKSNELKKNEAEQFFSNYYRLEAKEERTRLHHRWDMLVFVFLFFLHSLPSGFNWLSRLRRNTFSFFSLSFLSYWARRKRRSICFSHSSSFFIPAPFLGELQQDSEQGGPASTSVWIFNNRQKRWFEQEDVKKEFRLSDSNRRLWLNKTEQHEIISNVVKKICLSRCFCACEQGFDRRNISVAYLLFCFVFTVSQTGNRRLGRGWGVPRGMQEPAGYEQEEPQGR